MAGSMSNNENTDIQKIYEPQLVRSEQLYTYIHSLPSETSEDPQIEAHHINPTNN